MDSNAVLSVVTAVLALALVAALLDNLNQRKLVHRLRHELTRATTPAPAPAKPVPARFALCLVRGDSVGEPSILEVRRDGVVYVSGILDALVRERAWSFESARSSPAERDSFVLRIIRHFLRHDKLQGIVGKILEYDKRLDILRIKTTAGGGILEEIDLSAEFNQAVDWLASKLLLRHSPVDGEILEIGPGRSLTTSVQSYNADWREWTLRRKPTDGGTESQTLAQLARISRLPFDQREVEELFREAFGPLGFKV